MKNVFVQTSNVQNFYTATKEAEQTAGDPALLVFYGQAGRGKTSAARKLSAQDGWTYVRGLTMWSELWMLQDICFELSIDPIPGRKKGCFEVIKKTLLYERRVIIIDEADKLSLKLLEVIRDLADVTGAPFALVGEKLIKVKMQRERRIWSRTLRCIEFSPIKAKDILYFAKEAAGMRLTGEQAALLEQSSEGDFRLVARDVRRLESILQANPEKGITDDMVNLAIKQGLRGK